ncbi:MAG: hypothetical protein JST26_15390 [Bacteroidetes bacterium]|nr:hypothetical protein [Bacteroidota bacterium]
MQQGGSAIQRFRRGLFSQKVVTFLICLLVAALLWLVHALNRNYKYTLSIPVKFTNLPVNKVIIGELPDKLQFEIKTSGLKLAFIILKRHYNELLIDFNTLKSNAKSQAYSLSTGNLNLNSSINFDVDIIKIRPDTLFFSLNKGAGKIVPVKPVIDMTYEPGYQLIRKPIVTPAYITISGDSSQIRLIDTVYTNSVKGSEIHGNYSGRATLRKTQSAVFYNTSEVQVDLMVDRITEGEIEVPVKLKNAPPELKAKLLPATVKIKYLVAMKDYEVVNRSAFRAVVNYNDALAGKDMLPVELISFPSEVKVIQINPGHIQYLMYK